MAGLVSQRLAQDHLATVPAQADDNLEQKIRARIEKCWPKYYPSLATRPAPEIVRHRTVERGFSVMFEYELKFGRPRSEFVMVWRIKSSPSSLTGVPG